MNNHLIVNRTGLAFAAFVGGINLVWALLALLGLAQSLVTLAFQLHFITSPAPEVGPFNLGSAILLVVVASLIGYLLGVLFALSWNWLYPAYTPGVPADVQHRTSLSS